MRNSCFLIHGHNDSLKHEIARLIEKELNINVTILHEQSNRGKTIIEKFEANSDVDFAVALWTYDDEGKSKNDDNLTPRARQNVILETGYFFGRLGRDKVIVIHESGVEIPSDYHGILYISLKDNWKYILIKEIQDIYGNELDFNPSFTDHSHTQRNRAVDSIDTISENTKENLHRIIQLIEEKNIAGINEIQTILGVSRMTIQRYLKTLKDNNLIEYEGSSKTRGYTLKKNKR